MMIWEITNPGKVTSNTIPSYQTRKAEINKAKALNEYIRNKRILINDYYEYEESDEFKEILNKFEDFKISINEENSQNTRTVADELIKLTKKRNEICKINK